ncbi:DEAD/DEAH box helicase family protein [Microlunatus soli]|uniref:Shikimate kinase n=1 Tax=Microlunatus soli TaxID=630515 RepID=A0A1H2A4V0_9ACTN|nr:hypothetical protein [Microlunatus soli]SDT40950.1 hypothetical protein SAMN04489812_5667 [Microlunatus soli]
MKLLLIMGPPAVGKMTVGREIAARSAFRLFHNHHTIEPLVEVFGYGSPPFNLLNREFRRRVIEEATRHQIDLIFTFVWNLADPQDAEYLAELIVPVVESGGEVLVLELVADLQTRLERNRGESRLAAKPSKRDLVWSDDNVRQMDQHQLNNDSAAAISEQARIFFSSYPHLRLETTSLTVSETADRTLDWLAGI